MADLLYGFRWQDLLDIALLTLIGYRIILLVQGSRTVQIAIGLLIVAVAYYFSGLFGLVGLNWVLNNLFSSIIVVIIVLFQKDIRNAMAQVATKSFIGRGTNPARARDMLDRIYEVCEHLSKSRTGALIILEKNMGLGEFYTSATELNATFSDRLLVTIFNTHGPLHDGAVVINRDFQITHAGCILPLSAKIDFSKDLGTRHRAALGLSEDSDALVLVVSEETGQISLAHFGNLYRTPQVDVRLKLYDLYAKTERQIKKELAAAEEAPSAPPEAPAPEAT